jgi:hypothetical protein
MKKKAKETTRAKAKNASRKTGPIRDLEVSGRDRAIKGGRAKTYPPPC